MFDKKNNPTEEEKKAAADKAAADKAAADKAAADKAAADKAAEDFVDEDKAYVPKDAEKHLFHVELSKGAKFNSDTGEPIKGNTFIQKMKPKAYNQFLKSSKNNGYRVKVLHEPKA